ncbi:MAG: hypothetical protein WC521_06790 [Bdellovibrionales bacterium]|jgi:hypothetical protein
MTDEVKSVAMTLNADGYELAIQRASNGSVWLTFALPDGLAEKISREVAPMYRIDSQEAVNLQGDQELTEEGLGVVLYIWNPKWFTCILWHGSDAEGITEKNSLWKLFGGVKIVVRYYLSGGDYKETEFSLNGAKTVIQDAIGYDETKIILRTPHLAKTTINPSPEACSALPCWLRRLLLS